MRVARRAGAVLGLALAGVLLSLPVTAGSAAADTPTPVATSTVAPGTSTTTGTAGAGGAGGASTAVPSATPVAPAVTPAVTPAVPARSSAAATGPQGPSGPKGATDPSTVDVQLGGLTDKPSTSVTAILAVTLLSVLPALLLTCTSFTKILVVLGLTRNALGLQQTPPNQVLVGLALFLSLFIMGPVLSQMNDSGLQPYLNGTKTTSQALTDGGKPLHDFMIKHTDDDELQLLTNVAKRPMPRNKADVDFTTLIPAFVLTELKQAFVIGFVIFVPFLVIDIVVSGALMALGMMMMPPAMVSLPFKLLLFVLVNGWGLVITSLVASYQ